MDPYIFINSYWPDAIQCSKKVWMTKFLVIKYYENNEEGYKDLQSRNRVDEKDKPKFIICHVFPYGIFIITERLYGRKATFNDMASIYKLLNSWNSYGLVDKDCTPDNYIWINKKLVCVKFNTLYFHD